MCQLPTHPSAHMQPLSRTHLSVVRELWCSAQHVRLYVPVLTKWVDPGVGAHRQDSRQPWTRDITGFWEKNGENPAVPSAVAPGNCPPHFLGGCGEGWGAAQTTEKCGESAASAGSGGGCGGERRERKKRGRLPSRESHLRGLSLSCLGSLCWAGDHNAGIYCIPTPNRAPHQKEGRELTHMLRTDGAPAI